MQSDSKENAMTIPGVGHSAKRRDLEFEQSSTAPKKPRVLELHACNLQPTFSAAAVLPGAGARNNEAPESSKASQKKRSRQAETDAVTTSPPFTGKRGKRSDGSCGSPLSPCAAAAAIQAQMTSEGLEKDGDLEAEQAYISRRHQQQQQHADPAAAAAAAGASSSSSAWGASQDDAAGDAGPRQRDAAKSGRRRDQAPHHDSNGRDGQHSRRQEQRRSSSSAEQAGSEAAGGGQEEEPTIHLDLVPDKEWQRLFAVLTISSQPKRTDEAQAQPAAVLAGQAGSSSMQGVAAAAAAAAAPSTPKRVEGGSSVAAMAGGEAGLTPTRRSFLTTEFCRVQARHQAGRSPLPAAGQAGL